MVKDTAELSQVILPIKSDRSGQGGTDVVLYSASFEIQPNYQLFWQVLSSPTSY